MAAGGREKGLRKRERQNLGGLETREGFSKVGKVFGQNLGP